jgi:hypothetical protein
MDNQATIDRLEKRIEQIKVWRDQTLSDSNRADYELEIAQRSLVLEEEKKRSYPK